MEIELLNLLQAGIAALTAILLAYVLISKRTKSLAYRDAVRNLSVALMLFSVIEIFEFFGAEMIEETLYVIFYLILIYTLWATVVALYPKEEFS